MVFGLLLLCCGSFGTIVFVAADSSAKVSIARGGQTTTLTYDTREEDACGFSIVPPLVLVFLLLPPVRRAFARHRRWDDKQDEAALFRRRRPYEDY